MSTNKNAILRYKTLDRCLRNVGRNYSIEDLLEEVNNALIEEDPHSNGIRIRQLRDDIRFMRSGVGYDAPIETKIFDGKKHAYYYSDPKFSIHNSPLNETEAKQLKSSLMLLNRFSGAPGFEWVNELDVVLKDKLGAGDGSKLVSYESNIDYSGYQWITTLFNSIVQKKVLSIKYKPFSAEAFVLTFHPYYLKQYNNRWFIFGYNQEIERHQWNLSLDRIIEISETSKTYLEYDFDWEEYFSDFIGVTKLEGKIETVELLFSEKRGKYVETKPLHETQKQQWNENGLHVRLSLIPNFELEQVILSFGEDVEVLKPLNLRESIKKRVKMLLQKYQ